MTYLEALISTAVILIGAVLGLLIGAGIGAIFSTAYRKSKPLGVAIFAAAMIPLLVALVWAVSQ